MNAMKSMVESKQSYVSLMKNSNECYALNTSYVLTYYANSAHFCALKFSINIEILPTILSIFLSTLLYL